MVRKTKMFDDGDDGDDYIYMNGGESWYCLRESHVRVSASENWSLTRIEFLLLLNWLSMITEVKLSLLMERIGMGGENLFWLCERR